MDGKIEQAKSTLAFAIKKVGELKIIIPSIIQNMEENTEQANDAWQAFQSKYEEFRILADRELDLTDNNFAADPETWKELLSDMFKEKVNALCNLLEPLNDLFKIDVPVQQSILPFAYQPKYARLKEKNKLYSQYRKEIDRVEAKILRYITESIKSRGRIIEAKGLSDVIKTGDYAGCFHAYLPKPLNDHRIVYRFDGNKITFEIIGNHKEVGIN